jgi:hypothetical protein
MIKEVKMFTMVCDGCGKDVNEDTEYSCWNEVSALNDLADESGWEEIQDKHYCIYCYEYDDNDELIIKPKNLC